MKKIHLFNICLLLSGCFNTTQPANPQPSDTLPSVVTHVKSNDEMPIQTLEERHSALTLSDQKEFARLYNAQDVALAIYFEFDKFVLSDGNKHELQSIINYLNSHPDTSLLIVGHCDWYGTEDYNLRLGEKRANCVEQFLQTQGVTRTEVLSLGSIHASKGLSKADAWKDRRCDLVYYPLK